jgi:hypothetical protein
MKSLRLGAALAVVFVGLAVSPSEAKLAPVSWAEFVAGSDVIVRATMKSGELADFGSGRAVLSVVEILKGTPTEVEITVSWTSEVHDQRVTNLGGDYLLFLSSRDAGGYEAAVYGRSYWPIRLMVGPLFEFCEVVDYHYPLTYVELPEALQVEVGSPRSTECGELPPASPDGGILRVQAVVSVIATGGT